LSPSFLLHLLLLLVVVLLLPPLDLRDVMVARV
jgi:hypothetical protein